VCISLRRVDDDVRGYEGVVRNRRRNENEIVVALVERTGI
jgi:hypothetical protein